MFFAETTLAAGISGRPLNPVDSGHPGWFMYDLDLGESYEDVLVVRNSTDTSWMVDIYPSDSNIATGGAFSVKQKVEEMVEMGSWITLSKNEVLLGPGESINVPFTITIPESASVGETAGAIMFERRDPNTAEKAVDDQQGGVKISLRTGARVYNTVPGEIIQKLTFKDFDVSLETKQDGTKYCLVSADIENEGNVSTTAKYVTTITNSLSGEELDTSEVQFQILRGNTFSKNYDFYGLPKFGKLKVKLDTYVIDKEKNETFLESREESVWVIPVMEILIVLAIIAVIVAFILYQKKKYSGKGWVKYTVKGSENIMEVAAKHAVDWKLLAKTNKIKSPYLLTKGMSIVVPPKQKK